MLSIEARLSRKLFPHWLSPWWICVFLVVGLLPLAIGDLVEFMRPELRDQVTGFGMAWGLTIGLCSVLLAIISFLVQLVRLGLYISRRPRF
jgi:CHASE2 domain-containing sensor protein